MSQYYAAYYGSVLRLNKKEFDSFLSRYLDVNGATKKRTSSRELVRTTISKIQRSRRCLSL